MILYYHYHINTAMYHRVIHLAIILVCMFLVMPLHGQSTPSVSAQQRGDTLYITKAMLDKGFSLDSVIFRYHAGDDMAWSKSDYDDSKWQRIKNDTAGRRLMRDGIAWMRVHMIFDSTIAPTVVAQLSIAIPFGGAEIYLYDSLFAVIDHSSLYTNNDYRDMKIESSNIFIPIASHGDITMSIRVLSANRSTVQQWFGWLKTVQEKARFGLYLTLGMKNNHAMNSDSNVVGERGRRLSVRTFSVGVLFVVWFFLGYLSWFNKEDILTRAFYIFLTVLLIHNVPKIFDQYYRLNAHDHDISSLIVYVLNPISWVSNLSSLFFCILIYSERKTTFIHVIVQILIMCLYIIGRYFFSSTSNIVHSADFLSIMTCMIGVYLVGSYYLRSQPDINKLVTAVGLAMVCILRIFERASKIMSQDILPDSMLLFATVAVPISIAFNLIQRALSDRKRLARYSERGAGGGIQ